MGQAEQPRETPSEDDIEDLKFLRDEGLDLLAKLRQVRDPDRRRQIAKALNSFLDEQIRATQH